MKTNTPIARNEGRVKIELGVLLLEVLGPDADPDSIESDENLAVIREFIDDQKAREAVEYCVRVHVEDEAHPEEMDWSTAASQHTLGVTLRAIGNERYMEAFNSETGGGEYSQHFIDFITAFAELRTEQEIERLAA